jgi:phage terminase large subunit
MVQTAVTATADPKALDNMLRAARDAGCPPEQITNIVRARIVVQEKQLRASAMARLADQPGGPTMIAYGGARGGGKSFWSLMQMAVDDCQRVPGLKCLLLRRVGKAQKESLRDLLPQVLHDIPYSYTESGILTFPNGSRIIVGHFQRESDIDQYLGLEYDVIGIEEATTLTFSKFKNIRTCNRTSKTNWRPRMYLTTNPGGVGHVWFKTLFYLPYKRGHETDTRFVPATVDDNQFVDPDYKGKLNELTGWQYRAWRLGDFEISAGAFFTTWRLDVHRVAWFQIPFTWRVWASMDYGYAHFQAMYLFAQDDDGHIYVVDEHAARQMLTAQHIEAWRALLARNNVAQSRLTSMVAGGDVFQVKDADTQPIAMKYKAQGITLEPANTDRTNGAAQILTLLGDVERGIPPRLSIMDRCVKLIEQLPDMQHDPNRPEDVLKVDVDEDGMGGDDAYDGFRYGVMAVPAATLARQTTANGRVVGRGGSIG